MPKPKLLDLGPMEQLIALGSIPSDTTDVEFAAQPDGKYLAFHQTLRGELAVQIWGRRFDSFTEAEAGARRMRAAGLCRIHLEEPALTDEERGRWVSQIEDIDESRRVIAAGMLFAIGEEPENVRKAVRFGERLGHSGRRFVFAMNGGRKLVSHNVWGGTLLPAEIRAEYPDNAELLEGF